MDLRTSVALLAVCALGGCLQIDNVHCADGRICPQGSRCDDAHNRCISPDQIVACDNQPEGMSCMLAGAPGTCRAGICEVPYCGNGIREVGEECDGNDLGTADCTTAGFYYPANLGCSAFCTYDVSKCTGKCGDNVVDPGELCDGTTPLDLTCLDFGLDVGDLDCGKLCVPDLSTCGHLGWTRIAVPTSNRLDALWADSPRDIYAVGETGTAIHFDGHAWSTISFSTADPFYAVTGSGPNDIYIGGYGSLLEHWNGTSWSSNQNLTGTFSTIHGLFALSSSNVYAAAESGHLMQWNGATWSPVTTGAPATSIFDGVWARNATDVWAVGYTTSPVGPLVYHYNGTWSSVTTTAPSGAQIHAATGLDPSNVYLQGSTLTELVNNVWRQPPSIFSTLTGITSARGEVFVSAYNAIYALLPDLQTFTRDEQSVVTILRAIASDPAGHLWAAGDNGSFYGYRGTSWLSVSSGTIFNVRALWAADARHVYEVGYTTCAMFDGASFVNVNTTCGSNTNLNGVWGTSANDVFGVGDNGAIVHYDGNSWSPMTSGTTISLNAVGGSGPMDVYAVGSGGIIRHYNGSSWSAITSPTGRPLAAIWASDASHVFAVGAAGAIASFDGATWTSTTLPAAADLRGVWGSSPTDVWAVGTAGTIVHFDGSAWTTVHSPTSIGLSAVWGTGPRDVFAGGDLTTLLHYDGTQWSPVRVPQQDSTITSIAGNGRYVYITAQTLQHVLDRTAFPATASCAATETSCADAIDDDCDFLVDCADPDCRADAACAP